MEKQVFFLVEKQVLVYKHVRSSWCVWHTSCTQVSVNSCQHPRMLGRLDELQGEPHPSEAVSRHGSRVTELGNLPLTSSFESPHVIGSRAVFDRLRGETQQAASLRFCDLYSPNNQVVQGEVNDACRHKPMFLECRTDDDSIAQPHE
jgi:hypothetical protein